MGIVYRIFCKANNKSYVGSSERTCRRRKNEHWCRLRQGRHHSFHLQKAWNKYGEESFIYEVLEEDVEDLDGREAYWTEELQASSREFGFNIKEVKRISDETKAKISATLMGHEISRETRAKIASSVAKHLAENGHPFQGRKHTQEAKDACSKAHRGTNHRDAKLTEDDVRRIKALLLKKVKQTDIATSLRVSRSAVADISAGRTWKHIT